MNKELKAVIEKLINSILEDKIKNIKVENVLKFESLTPEQVNLLRGEPGKDFDLSANTQLIQYMVEGYLNRNKSDFTLKLTPDELKMLKGEKGDPGSNGSSVDISEIENIIDSKLQAKMTSMFSEINVRNMIAEMVINDRDNYRLRFEDLTDDQLLLLKGEKGDEGKAFDPVSNFDLLQNIVKVHMNENRRLFSVNFSDLTKEEIESLKGEQGKGFVFSEHEDSVRNIIADNFAACAEDLKLKFSDLTDEEKDQIRFKFEHLTEDQLKMIAKFAGRGQRGREGDDAYQIALSYGFKGSRVDWLMSLKGKDAPKIKSAELKRLDDSGFFYLSLEMSDGSKVETNSVRL